MNIDNLKKIFVRKGDKMKLFKEIKNNKYIDNMTIGAKTQLSLLETLNALQHEYEEYFTHKEKETEQLVREISVLKAEVLKIKANK